MLQHKLLATPFDNDVRCGLFYVDSLNNEVLERLVEFLILDLIA